MILYDRLAPTRDLDRHTPSFVLMRCMDFVTGSIQHASRFSSVENPFRVSLIHTAATVPERTYRLYRFENLLFRVELRLGLSVWLCQLRHS
jgi:hypothetical protein